MISICSPGSLRVELKFFVVPQSFPLFLTLMLIVAKTEQSHKIPGKRFQPKHSITVVCTNAKLMDGRMEKG